MKDDLVEKAFERIADNHIAISGGASADDIRDLIRVILSAIESAGLVIVPRDSAATAAITAMKEITLAATEAVREIRAAECTPCRPSFKQESKR